ncbi:MAG TPA: NAD(P)/FAD-dependent oxidoreductase [Acidimicrobiia bacterium]|nr:NAD(P)/FAD-dependent oxidoreductase [Acidimicrobiia bacterium]
MSNKNDSSRADTTYDVLIVGGGAAGENAADIAARGGLRVALIEHDLLGGECTYWACMPSKALLRPGEALAALRRVPGALEAASGDIDVDEALARRDALVAHWDDSAQVEWLDGVGVDLIRGHGRIVGERQVSVTDADGADTLYEAQRAVVVATGSSASFPPIQGLAEAGPWDSRDVTTAKEVPRRLIVIGGGGVGVEMAQAWKWLGAEEVTIIELFDHLLSREEKFAGDELESALVRMGITVHTSASTQSVRRPANDGSATAQVDLSDGTSIEIEADQILVATGRQPNTADLGLETIGLEPGEEIEVDDHLRATAIADGWLYAVGDVNGRSLLTHTGKYQARIAGAHIAGLDTTAWGDRVALPRVVFTSPEVAAVGLTETEAEEEDIEVRTVEYEIGRVAGASVLGRGYRGTCKLVVDADREVIVGATFVGPRVGELLHAATIAIVAEVPLTTLWHAIPAFPTLSEVWLRLLERYRDEYGKVYS